MKKRAKKVAIHNPIRFNDLCLSGELWTYPADLDEQAQNRLEPIIEQMKTAEGVTEDLKQYNQKVLVTLIQTIVERIYIVNKDDARFCHIFIKDCSGEDYIGFFQAAGCIEQEAEACPDHIICLYVFLRI